MKVVFTKDWKALLEKDDSVALWQGLHRLVATHPMVRSAQRNQNTPNNSTPVFSVPDLTQDLYVLLLEKSRFQHYLEGRMTGAEIEREIFQIELTNMLIGQLRRRRPENYRIVRRISQVLESEPRFRPIRAANAQPARYRQAANEVYGLREWGDGKPVKDAATFENLIASVPMRTRNRRRVGCRGEAQMIVTNQELVELLVEIFQAVDSPAPLRVLRTLALSKLPVYDAVITSIEQEAEEEERTRGWHTPLVSTDASPETLTLKREQEMMARRAAHDFLDRVDRLTRSQPARTERLWRVLWHSYFDPAQPSQLAIAASLGMSDSSVSDYRRKMENEMRRLDFAPEQLRYFAEELEYQLRRRLDRLDAAKNSQKSLPATPPARKSLWPQSNYSSLATLDSLPVV